MTILALAIGKVSQTTIVRHAQPSVNAGESWRREEHRKAQRITG
jgi:hypothetical protein